MDMDAVRQIIGLFIGETKASRNVWCRSTRLDARLPILIAALVCLPVLIVVLAACTSDTGPTTHLPISVSGVVTGPSGPLPNAIVQVQGTPNKTTTAQDGTFRLHGEGLGGTSAITLTAWASDHTIGAVGLDPQHPTWQAGDNASATGVQLTLRAIPQDDNHKYSWFSFEGKTGSASCGVCHREYAEWQTDGHSQSATNPRFLSMYRGTNIKGELGQSTRFTASGGALLPDPKLPNFGPGFKLDNIDRPGNCATCHAPLAAKAVTTNSCAWSGCHTSLTADRAEATKYQTDIRGASPTGLMGIAQEGIACEFCHVVRAVTLDPVTHLPYADAPGIMSLELRRPQEGHKLFFGTLTDPNRTEVTFSPFESRSEFCAACHHGVMGGVVSNMKVTGGVVIYNAYGEWLQSRFADPANGKSCQDCHMPTKSTTVTVPVDKGGVSRTYTAYHDHSMVGPSSQTLLWNAVTMKSAAERAADGKKVSVHIDITNDKTGHAVPTDAPIRSVMLVVEATDANGKPLALQQGPALPDWTGDYAGQPGKAFAKILKDNWTGETPTAAYWRPVTIVSDTRLMPQTTDTTSYTFALPDGGRASVHIRLIYRRAFQQLAQQKGWNDPDIVMADETIEVKS